MTINYQEELEAIKKELTTINNKIADKGFIYENRVAVTFERSEDWDKEVQIGQKNDKVTPVLQTLGSLRNSERVEMDEGLAKVLAQKMLEINSLLGKEASLKRTRKALADARREGSNREFLEFVEAIY